MSVLPLPVPASPLPTPSPVPPTPVPSPTAVPPVPLRISAQLDPPTPRAGTDFVLRLMISNDGERIAHGVFIATSGPWERWTVLEVVPGTFARDAAGWRIVSPIDIPPKETRPVEVRIRADAPSEEQLTFAVREAEPGELR
jgi:hypothetical protein